MRRIFTFCFLFMLMLLCSKLFAQTTDTCSSRLAIAHDLYQGGKFADALRLLDDYEKCSGRTSDYFKLKAKIYLALDSNNYSLQNTVQYVQSKTGNYITDDDPAVFKNMVQYVQDSLAERQISSVSKRPEDIDLTPASVIVIKSEDMAKRGYGNLVDLLSDLPGFDITRIYSVVYADIFQNGFEQDNTERTLFMIDGVEENDVWSNIAYISRQYPLSDISEVQVIYGPASTLYGARAFVGAINIITKSYKELANKKLQPFVAAADSSFGVHASGNFSYGSYNTRNLDVTIAGKTSDFTWVVSGAYYESNQENLDFQNIYGYGADQVNKVPNSTYATNLKKLVYTGTQGAVDSARNQFGPGYFTKTANTNGTYTLKINPDSLNALIKKARAADMNAFNQTINGAPIGYSNHAADWFVSGKIRTGNFEAGFKTWKLRESFNYYQSLFNAGTNNGSQWAPINSSFYTNYDKRFGNFTFSNLSSYQISGLADQSDLVTLNSFYSEVGKLSLLNLFEPNTLVNGTKDGWMNKFYYYKGEQFRTDTKLAYSKDRLSILGGFEYRYSQLQGDYLTYSNYATATPVDQSKVAYAQELGTTATNEAGGNEYATLDLGVYSQATYQFPDSIFYATAGGRFDYNRINSNAGFGKVFSPKLALVSTLKTMVLKLIYSQGIQNPSQSTKFSTSSTRVANPTLQPEKIHDLELVLLNKHGKSDINWDLTLSYATILDAVSSGVDPYSTTFVENLNTGKYTIYTGMYEIIYHPQQSHWDAYFNATYERARQTANTTVTNFQEQVIGDIAPYKFNIGGNYAFNIDKNYFNIDLRANYVGNRPEGKGTTISANTGVDSTNRIPQYLLFNSAITYQNRRFKHFTLQFDVDNILNTLYYDPGPRNANANFVNAISGYVPYVAQRDRNFLLTLKYNL